MKQREPADVVHATRLLTSLRPVGEPSMLSAISALHSAGSLLTQSAKPLGDAFQQLFSLTQSSAASQQQLAHQYERTVDRLHQLVRQQLKDSGIDLRQSVELRFSGLGAVRADSFHPQRDLIEQSLNQNPSLVQQFAELTRLRHALDGLEGNGRELRVEVSNDQIHAELI